MPPGRRAVWLLLVALELAPRASDAVSIRKQCRQACGAAIDACIADGGRRRRCKRQTLKRCRREGLVVCVPPTTTSTTTVAGATTLPGGTTLPGATTTTSPQPTTTTAPGVAVNGCSLATAVDRRAPAADRTITFANYAYDPPCMLIAPGQQVTFSGVFGAHPLVGGTVVGQTATPDASSPIPSTSAGSSQPVSFPDAGTFPFYCEFHGVTLMMYGAVFVAP